MWRAGGALYVIGATSGLLGAGLVLSGAVVTEVHDRDLGTRLVLAGDGTKAGAFLLTSLGLGLQHRALDRAGVDAGYGLYGVGTTLNLLGLAGLGVSYGLAWSTVLEQPDRGTAVAVSALSGSALMVVGGILYFADQRRMRRALHRWGSF